MSGVNSPEGVCRVTDLPAAENEYVFSNGQVPPELAVVWYDGGRGAVDPGHAVVLYGQGPLTEDELRLRFDGFDDNDTADAYEESVLAKGDGFITEENQLSVDPRMQGEGVAEAQARDVAERIFALVAQQ